VDRWEFVNGIGCECQSVSTLSSVKSRDDGEVRRSPRLDSECRRSAVTSRGGQYLGRDREDVVKKGITHSEEVCGRLQRLLDVRDEGRRIGARPVIVVLLIPFESNCYCQCEVSSWCGIRYEV